MNVPAGRRHIAELDGVRGAAIFAVLAIHFGGRVPAVGPLSGLVQALCDVGWVGVDLFFCVSGFLITGILLDTRGRDGFYKNFYARRALRIFPLYFGVLAAVFVVLPAVAPSAAEDGIASGWLWTYFANVPLAYTGPASFRGETLNFAHFWSLAIEEQFYLVWPLAVATLGPAGLKRLCVVTLLVATPARFASLAAIGTYAPYYLTWCKLDALVAGAWLAVALRGPAPDVVLKRAGRLGAVCFASLAAWFVVSGNLFCFDPVVSTVAPPLVAGACVGVVATAVAPSPFVSRVLTWRPLAELGRVSYGVYVFHGLLQIVFLRTLGDIAVTAGNYWTTWLVFMAFTVGVSYLLARASFVIESRFLRLKRHFVFDGPPRLGQAATTAG